MDKYEYKLKSDQIKKLYEGRDFKTLLNVADSIDWRKVNSNVLLNIVADAYEQENRLEEACDLLLMAYDRTTFGRNLAYRLCQLSVKLGRMSEAVDFYTDFVRKAPKDPNQFILKYEILKAKNAGAEELIKALEAYLVLDIDEKWQYELALLYKETDQGVKCIELCNEISLWFSETDYVKKALDLKKEYMPLTQEQERKYNGLPAVQKEEPKEEESQDEYFSEDYQNDEYFSEEQTMLMDAIKDVVEFKTEEDSSEEDPQDNEIAQEEEYFHSEEIFKDEEMQEISTPDVYIPEEEFEVPLEEPEHETFTEELEEPEITENPQTEPEEEFEEVPETQEAQDLTTENIEIPEEEIIDEQIEGQMTLENLLEVYQEKEDEETRQAEEERLARAELIAERTKQLREEVEKQNNIELDGPFGDIFAKELESEPFTIEEENDEDETYTSDEAQEEQILSPDMKSQFERYLPINNMEKQLAITLNNLINCYNEDGTSSTNNIVIMGDEKSGKTSLIIDIIKVVNKERNRSGRKIAKIKGESLNRKGMSVTMPKLFGSDLIIERAGNLNPETIQDLVNVMKGYTEDMIVILEDSEVAIERLFKVNKELIDLFTNIIKIKEIGVKEWVEVAKDYSRRRGYIVDEMGTLALHVKIGNAYSRELKLEPEEIEAIVDEAIEKSKRKKRYSKKHKVEGFAVLRESDFM